MIPIEKQVTNLELSKRLAAAGAPQESLWCWYAYEVTLHPEVGLFNNIQDEFFICAAYTPAELGEWLKNLTMMPVWNIKTKKWMRLFDFDNIIREDTEADVRGEMLFYLIKNGYTKPEELT